MSKEVLHKATVNTGKYPDVLITRTNETSVGKIIFDFHSVSKDYFPAAVLTDEENFGCGSCHLRRAEFLPINNLAL